MDLKSVGALTVVVLLVLAEGSPTAAGCTLDDDAIDARRSARRAAQCNDKILRSGTDVSCNPIAPPACAGSVTADAVALGYGPNNPPTGDAKGKDLADQRNCQRQIGKGVSDYLRKLILITKGRTEEDAEETARRQLDKLPLRCAVMVAQAPSGVVIPQVGPQCAEAVGGVGETVDGTKLRDCLLTLMHTWVDRIVPSPVPPRPNVVLILSDDQRWDTVDGTHGIGGADVMPEARAQIGGEGVTFDNYFMTTPLCCPSRSSLLAGQYAHRTGVYSNQGENGGADDFDDRFSMGVWLQANGYRTGFVGKYLNGYGGLWNDPAPPYVPPGWDEWHAFPGAKFYNYELVRNGIGYDHVVQSFGSAEADYSTDVLRDIAIDFIQTSVQQGEPFFLYFAPKAPHLPREPAPRHIGLFSGVPPWRPPNHNEADVSDKPSWVQNTSLLDAAEIDDIDDLRQNQLEMLQAVDEAIGGSTTFGITGILPTLRNLGVLDDTIVIYISDNGYHWGEHRFTAKSKPYEEAIRSHMMVRYPKLAPLPRTESRFALNIDLAPTLAELAGFDIETIAQQIDPTFQVDGVSIAPLLDGSTPPESWRTDLMTEGWPASHVWATVREGQWKYTELPVTPGDPATTFELELYDLVSDPYELSNVSSDPQHASRIAAMAARLREIRSNWPLDADPTVDLPEED